MAVLGKFPKQPVEVLDYQFDFSAWLLDRADTILGVPTVTVSDLTGGSTSPITISDITTSSGVVKFFASGGDTGCRYKITCTIATAGARVKQAEMIITVKDT